MKKSRIMHTSLKEAKKINEVFDPRWNFSGNMKVGNVATWSTLASDQEFSTKFGPVRGTCCGCCEHCGHSVNGKRPPCYVFKSYRYSSVVEAHARNTISMRNDPEKCFQDLSDQLARKRKMPVAARFDQSGEVENTRQFSGMCKCASDHRIPFYVYSKKYAVMIAALVSGLVPKNFFTLFSVWHDQGVREYLSVSDYGNTKAFVYCDSNRDSNGWGPKEYAEHGLKIDTFCPAYDKKGKMNKALTCAKCRKCFDDRYKVIGTWAH